MRVRLLVVATAASLAVGSCGDTTVGDSSDVRAAVASSTAAVTVPEATTGSIAPTTTSEPPSTSMTAATSTTAATTTATSTTTTGTTTTTLPPPGDLAAGLFCRDLGAMGYDYSAAVAYWIREGSPDRMDADGNGIPCETVYSHDEVVAVWGDPLPTTTTTLSPDVYTVDQPEYGVAPLPGSGGKFGSGCTPGSDTLADGVWFGAWDTRSAASMQFDLMCLAPDPHTVYLVTNSSARLRTLAIDPAARVYRMGDDGTTWDLVSYSAWLVTPSSEFCWGQCPVWLYVNGGRVTEVVELWFA